MVSSSVLSVQKITCELLVSVAQKTRCKNRKENKRRLSGHRTQHLEKHLQCFKINRQYLNRTYMDPTLASALYGS